MQNSGVPTIQCWQLPHLPCPKSQPLPRPPSSRNETGVSTLNPFSSIPPPHSLHSSTPSLLAFPYLLPLLQSLTCPSPPPSAPTLAAGFQSPVVTDPFCHTPAPAPCCVSISGAGVGMAGSPRAFGLPQALRSVLHMLSPVPIESHSHPTSYR